MRLLYPVQSPLFTENTPLNLAVKVDGVPSGDLDIAISGDYITTVNATITAQQAQSGYCFQVYGTSDVGSRLPCTITVSATNGITESAQFTGYLSNDVEDVNTKWTPFMMQCDGYSTFVRERPDALNIDNYEDYIQLFREQVFEHLSGSLPSGAPYQVNNNPTSMNSITLTHANLSSKKQVIIRNYDLDGYYFEYTGCHVQNSVNTGVLVFSCFGHGEIGHQDMFDAVMSAGHDFAAGVMPAVTNNPNVMQASWASRHDGILLGGVDRDGYDGRCLFVEDKIKMLDWILTQKSYTKIIICGISGGGHTVGIWGALDTRPHKIFNFRGAYSQAMIKGGNEFEYADSTYFDWNASTYAGPRQAAKLKIIPRTWQWLLCAAGGREYHSLRHLEDGLTWPEMYFPELKAKGTELGGLFTDFVGTDPAQATHGYQPDEIAYMIANI